jgi:hypothetical protein
MFQACRPTGRLFYWVLAVLVTASSVRGSGREETSAGKAAASPTAKPAAAKTLPRAASPAPQSGPALTVASGCSTIQSGDTVVIDYTDTTSYWGVHGPVTVAGTSITYAQTGANIAAQATPGVIAIENAAVEDNALPGTMRDTKIYQSGSWWFNEGYVFDNDQAATVDVFNENGGLLCTVNHCGSYFYSAGNTAGTPVLWISHANITPQCGGNGVTVYANNTTHISDSVIQGFGMWGIYTSTILGSYGGTQVDIEFQREVLDKLIRLETKMDALVGNGQPGRMKTAEDKVAVLERNDLRNSVHNRIVNGAISAAVSLAIALHKYWLK